MYCSKCGKEIDDTADVCLGCGTFVHQTKSKSINNKMVNGLSIGTLVFGCLFALLGLLAFVACSANYSLEVIIEESEVVANSAYVQIDWLMLSVVSLFAVSLSSLSALILLFSNGNKRVNISTICISGLMFVIAGLISMFALNPIVF